MLEFLSVYLVKDKEIYKYIKKELKNYILILINFLEPFLIDISKFDYT